MTSNSAFFVTPLHIIPNTVFFVGFFLIFLLVMLLDHSLILNILLPHLQIPLKLSTQGLLQPAKPIVLKVVPRDAVVTGA